MINFLSAVPISSVVIRIRMDRISFVSWSRIRNQGPDPHQSDKRDPELDPDLHQFVDDKFPRYQYTIQYSENYDAYDADEKDETM
jgi:hypothetical protein